MKYTSHIKPIQTFPERIPTDSKLIQTNSNRFKRIQTDSSRFKRIQTDSNGFKRIQMNSNSFKSSPIHITKQMQEKENKASGI